MAGPWEKYAAQPMPASDGPWSKYATPAAPEPVEMAPEYDAMGNLTGGMVPSVAAPSMSYGDQMRKVGGLIDDGVRLAANGMTFGMADRFAGAMDAATGQAPSYSEGVDRQAARTKALRDAAPIASAITEGVGGLATGVGLIKNGVTLAGHAGPGLIGRMGAFGLEGAGYGAAHGAGNTYSQKLGDYLENASEGAWTGAFIGTGIPLAGAAASGAYRLGRTLMSPNVQGVSRTGSTLLRSAAEADEAGLRALPEFGAEGMLPDAGPSMLGLAQGAATGNGAGKSALVNTLRERDLGTNRRIGAALDENFGPAPDLLQVESGLAQARTALAPHYEVHLTNATAADTRSIANRLDEMAVNLRGEPQKLAIKVRDMLNVRGTQELDPNPRTLLATRQAIDDIFTDKLGPNAKRALTEARAGVDAALTKAAPGIKNVDNRFAELKRQSEALERGGQILNTGKEAIRPAGLSAELADASPAQIERMRQGSRAELDRVTGTQLHDLPAVERMIGRDTDWNYNKLGQLHGGEARDNVVDAVRQNRRMRDTFQRVDQGSKTAQRTANERAFDEASGARPDMTITGAAMTYAQRLAKTLMGMSRESTKDEVARALSKVGPSAQALAENLLRQASDTAAGAHALGRMVSNPAYLGASSPVAGRR